MGTEEQWNNIDLQADLNGATIHFVETTEPTLPTDVERPTEPTLPTDDREKPTEPTQPTDDVEKPTEPTQPIDDEEKPTEPIQSTDDVEESTEPTLPTEDVEEPIEPTLPTGDGNESTEPTLPINDEDNPTESTFPTDNANKPTETVPPASIKEIKNVELSKISLTYTGKVIKPTVIAKDDAGNVVGSENYDVAYSDNKKVGQATVTVTFKGNYKGDITKTFTIVPKGTKISKISAEGNGFLVKWKKQKKQTTGYEIQYSTSKKFKGAKSVKVGKNKTTSKSISNLKRKKKYYVRIRTYKTVKINGKSTKVYSEWSKAKILETE